MLNAKTTRQMEMVIVPTEQLRAMLIEAASIAVRHNMPAPATAPAPVDELLTPEETAQLLKVSKTTIWDWAKRGILNKRTIGNQVRYLRSEVLAAPVPTRK